MFDEPTREGSQRNLIEDGTAFAGRGGDLNEALRHLDPLANHVEPVARNLASAKTSFDRLFPAFAQAAAEAAPVAQSPGRAVRQPQPDLHAPAPTTRTLQQAIAGGPARAGHGHPRAAGPGGFDADSTELFRRFRPPSGAGRRVARPGAGVPAPATPSLKASPQLNDRLVATLSALDAFAATRA